jgi:hypothetical protein
METEKLQTLSLDTVRLLTGLYPAPMVAQQARSPRAAVVPNLSPDGHRRFTCRPETRGCRTFLPRTARSKPAPIPGPPPVRQE